uniref:Uncharacterized protein n=1 Tax=Lepeophtheirus salmonis TaxID=72036 RepID=A0A0K2TB81_LEPSM
MNIFNVNQIKAIKFYKGRNLNFFFCVQYLAHGYKIVCNRRLTVPTKSSFDKIALYLPWKEVFEASNNRKYVCKFCSSICSLVHYGKSFFSEAHFVRGRFTLP